MSPDVAFDVDRLLTDVDYVLSDLHLNHENIVEYCRSDQFEADQSGLDDMNWQLMANWNRTVDPEETVLFLGDFAWFRGRSETDRRKVRNLRSILNGEIVFVRGDHDYIHPDDSDADSSDDWSYSAIVEDDGRRFFAAHFPGDTPEELPGKGMPAEFERRLPTNYAERWDGWLLHGHHHNSWPEQYPLVAPDSRTINCSSELTGYRPLPMKEIHRFVEGDERVQQLPPETGRLNG